MATRIMSEKESWKFIQEQPGKHFKWTREPVEGGWHCRQMTDAEIKASQREYSALLQAHQDSLPG